MKSYFSPQNLEFYLVPHPPVFVFVFVFFPEEGLHRQSLKRRQKIVTLPYDLIRLSLDLKVFT